MLIINMKSWKNKGCPGIFALASVFREKDTGVKLSAGTAESSFGGIV